MTSDFLRRGLSRRSLLAGLGVAAVGFSITSCGKGNNSGAPASSTSTAADAGEVNFYNWDTYIGETTLEDFKTATGVKVNMSLFSTNDELFAKLRAGNPGFDVIVPSNEFVTRLAQSKLLMPLDKSQIPNMANIAPEFQDADYDPGRVYSMPYTWLVLGIGYRKSKMDGIPDSWKWVFDSDKYAGRIALLSESSDLIRLCSKYLGHSVNGIPPDTVTQIEAMLKKQKPNVHAFHEDNGQDLLLSGEVDIVIEYNGDIAQVMREDKDLDFVVPQEGSLLNSDTLCIPAGAPNVANAHKFINYVLDGQAGAEISKTILYPTPNAAAKALMPDDYKNNPVVFPPASILAKCEYGKFEGPEVAQLYEQVITRVRAE